MCAQGVRLHLLSSRSLFLSKSSLEMCGILGLKGFGLQAIQGAGGGPAESPEAHVLVCTPSSAGHLPGGMWVTGLEGAVASLHPVGLQLRRLVLHKGGCGGRGREARGHGSRVAIAHEAGDGGRRGGVRILVIGGWWVLGIGWAGRRVLKER